MKDSSNYQIFNLIGNEFTFDVDVSQLPCGLNGALYFVVMDPKGQGTAGAKYGTGYCDGQCPRDLKFINGKVGNGLAHCITCPANGKLGQYGRVGTVFK